MKNYLVMRVKEDDIVQEPIPHLCSRCEVALEAGTFIRFVKIEGRGTGDDAYKSLGGGPVTGLYSFCSDCADDDTVAEWLVEHWIRALFKHYTLPESVEFEFVRPGAAEALPVGAEETT